MQENTVFSVLNALNCNEHVEKKGNLSYLSWAWAWQMVKSDQRNQSIPLDSVRSVDVNKSIQRSLTKACARHGLGLYIYAGEDLPDSAEQPRRTQPVRQRMPQQPQQETVPPPTAQDYYSGWRQSRSQYVAGRNNQ